MKILLYTHFFPPESGAAPMRMQYFAEALENYDLKIITPKPNYPQNKLIDNWKKKIPHQFVKKIKHISLVIPSNRFKFSRIISYFTYMISSFVYSNYKFAKVDVVVSSSPPITTAFMAAFFASIRKKNLIIDIRDMWPQIGVELGILTNSFSVRILRWMEKHILNKASKIIVTAEGDKKNLVERGIDKSRISIIYNGADTDKFQMVSPQEKVEIRKNYNLPTEKKILIYFGSFNYGMNDLDTLAQALKLLNKTKDLIHFVAVGNGEKKEEFIRAVGNGIELTSLNSLSVNDIAKLVAAADVSLIPRKEIKQDTGGNVPVKCFESWACGVPTILSSISDSDVEKIFNRCGAGLLVSPGNAIEFSDAINKLVTNNNLDELGKKGRQFVIDNFDRRKQSEKLIQVIEEIEKI